MKTDPRVMQASDELCEQYGYIYSKLATDNKPRQQAIVPLPDIEEVPFEPDPEYWED